MPIAILDSGTNTVLLLVAEKDAEGSIHVLCDDHAIARLGEGVDRDRNISEEAYQRFLAVLREHIVTARSLHCERIVAVATSAMRDAENRDEIIRRTKNDTGIDIKILSGEDESRWTYNGALLGMTFESNHPVAVVDIGGGSTEISIGDGKHFERGISIDIGAVRITERYFSTSPITKEAAENAQAFIRTSLKTNLPDPMHPAELVAVAGTATTLAAMHQDLPKFVAASVHNYRLRMQAVTQLLDVQLKVDAETLLRHFPAINKARADILPAGTLILAEVMDYLGIDAVRVSTQGLRYGIALRELSEL
jgi:exopolyphosphatase / guanosine-5'-triphosphate,3'-diphosphate pyrophosphatase